MRHLALTLLLLLCLGYSQSSRTLRGATFPLIQPADLTFLGTFRVPSGTFGTSTFSYGGHGLAFRPDRNSLYIVGHSQVQHSAEISIPAFNSTATVLQPFHDVANGAGVGGGQTWVGGHLVFNGLLYATKFIYYDASGSQTQSHFQRSSLSLSTGSVAGPMRAGPLGAGFYSGYMTEVPAEWQADLGGPALTGNCCLNIISRTSYGPAAFAFDPGAIGNAVPLVYYDTNHQTLGPYNPDGQSRPVFNGTTRINGIVLPSNTSSVLFFGVTGIGPYCYGEAAQCGDPTNQSKGGHAAPYRAYVWAYDANDLAAVKAGSRQPWTVVPYATWELPDMGSQIYGEFSVSAAFDQVSRRLYLSKRYGDGDKPLIYVYSIAGGSAPPPVAVCADGIDNDGDGLTDFPNDPGCTSTSDGDETNTPVSVEVGAIGTPADLSNQTSKTWTITPTGIGQFLMLAISGWDNSSGLTAATVTATQGATSVSLPFISGDRGANLDNVVLWGKTLDGIFASGPVTVRITGIPSGFAELAGGPIAFTGVQQQAPSFVAFPAVFGGSIAVQMNVGDLGVDVLYGGLSSPNPAPGANETQRMSLQFAGGQKWFKVGTEAGVGSVQMNWTPQPDEAIGAVVLKAAY